MPNILRYRFVLFFCVLLFAVPTQANDEQATDEQATDEQAAVLAVADQALARINNEDMEGFTNLMLPEAMLFSTSFRDGVYRYQARTRGEERAMVLEIDINERGFDPTVLVAGPVAMVWYPYDLYVDGNWTHCGVDVFSLVQTQEGWKIASLTWSAEQPPACQPHPDGPPKS